MEEKKTDNKTKTTVAKEKKGFFKTLKKRKNWILPVLLALALVITVFYYKYALNKQQTVFKAEKTAYITKYTNKVDSVNVQRINELSTVFSWSVRAELMRNNKEQVGLLLNQFVKTPHIQSISFINNEEVIEIATDKKVEGKKINNLNQLKQNSLPRFEETLIPITGINETLGYLDFKFEGLKSKLDKQQ